MKITDVMIHIDEPLSEAERTSLEDAMRKLEGVVSPRFNPGTDHLLMVAFDLDKTTTTDLLKKARAAGYTAQLVGA